MSAAQKAEEQEFDFWEFVSCARCHLPFVPEGGGPPAVPFWITECGHVVCNNHLKPNRTCARCETQDIEVAPLQREMDAPMSSWFTSVPHAFDTLAFATRFQIETLASLVRYFKRKYMQHRQLIERLKGDITENRELKRTIEELRLENERLRSQMAEPSETLNINGKRAMQNVHRHPNGAFTNSSPQSSIIAISTNRITLPPSHKQPAFLPPKSTSEEGHNNENYPQRPSSRHLEQYAYVPPRTQQLQTNPTPLSHAQAASARQALSRRQAQDLSQDHAHIPMLPPPGALNMNMNGRHAPSNFRPAPASHLVRRNAVVPNGPRDMPLPLVQTSAQHPHPSETFRIPATPRGPPQAQQTLHQRFPDQNPARDFTDRPLQTNRFMPAASSIPSQRLISTSSGPQRFATPAPVSGQSHSGLVRTHTDLGNGIATRVTGSGQRLPFRPGGHNGFG